MPEYLYNKGLYLQSLKVLDRMKEMARANDQLTYLSRLYFLKRKSKHFTLPEVCRERADQLAKESDETNCQLSLVNRLSNLSLQLYSWYINNGHAEMKKSEELKNF